MTQTDEIIITSRVPEQYYNPPPGAPVAAVPALTSQQQPNAAAAGPAPAASPDMEKGSMPAFMCSSPSGYPPGYPAAYPYPAGYPVAAGGAPPPAYYGPGGYPGQQPVVVKPGSDMACGCGAQLTLFIIGWLFSPCWWVASIMYCCSRQKDPRERGAFIANMVMSFISIALLVTLLVLVATGTFTVYCYGYYC